MAKKKKVQQSPPAKMISDLAFNLKIDQKIILFILAAIMILTIAVPVYYLSLAKGINGEHGFPLDDPWIHLTFAKNLVEYGSFSYFRNEIVTAGSTSPVYTLILAAGYIVVKNEMILSYILGILFFALSAFYYYKVSGELFKENWLAITAVLLFIFDRWLVFISVSGMETTMFIFLIIVNFYYYRRRNPVWFAVTFGLIFWTRPDGIAYLGAVLVDYGILYYIRSKSKKRSDAEPLFSTTDLKKIGLIAVLLLIAYLGMNLFLSGSLLPNTYNAKLTYYSPEFRSRADFLKFEVWEYFTYSSYMILIIPFIFAVIRIIFDTGKLRYNKFLIPAVFIFALIFIYWYKLPYAHRFGRYLMPVIPFYILLFVYGSRIIFEYIYKFLTERKMINGLNVILFAIALYAFTSDTFGNDPNIGKVLYTQASKHITIRQVAAAKWLAENTPEDAVIATHDVGAIAFYSNRKIVDVAGLINPEFTPNLLKDDYSKIMTESMNKYGVTHVAFLREWYQIVNQDPLFTAGTDNFEIMDIYEYKPEKTHVLNTKANSGNKYALDLMNKKQLQQAIGVLNQTLAIDPRSSQTYYYLGVAYAMSGDALNAEKYLKRAIELYPESSEMTVSLADLYNKTNRVTEAKKILNNFLNTKPYDTLVVQYLSTIQDSSIVSP